MTSSAQTIASLHDPAGLFRLVGWQDSEVLAELFGFEWSEPESQDFVKELVGQLMSELGQHATGLVLDPRSGLEWLDQKPADVGLALRLTEFQTAQTIQAAPKLLPNWSIEQVSNNYAAAYVQLYYHPSEAAALEKKQLIAELYDFCQYEKIGLFLDIALTLHEDQENREAVLLEAITEFRTTCNLIGLPYPGNPLLSATVTSELDKPWILSSSDQSYDVFKEQVRAAIESGAQGFLISGSLYRDLEAARLDDMSPDQEAISKAIKTVLRDRMIELVRIAKESQQQLF